MKYYTRFDTPLCEIILFGDSAGLSNILLNTNSSEVSGEWLRDDAFFKNAEYQIKKYLSGKRTKFDIKINPQGTEFQKKVWNELTKIPYGKLCSYRDIATSIGNPKACRAVGMANSKNPIPLIIPCHRVIGKNGSLTGFSSGIAIKEKLIKLEAANNNITNKQ